MQNCISKFTRAPIQYITQLRALKTGSITMSGTTFYPAFPLALLSSLLCLCGLSAYMIYYFFTMTDDVCYQNITWGIIALAIIYPIQAVIIYVCVFGSVALAESYCWKVMAMVVFGLVVTGFSFGGLGFAFLCTISQVNTLLIPSSFLSSNTFIQIIVYSYLSFFILYILLVPLLTISYNERNKNPSPKSSCSDTFCCVIFYICQFLFMVTAVFMILIKLLGPPLLIYVLVQVVRAGFQNSQGSMSAFFALSVLSIVLPFAMFWIVYFVANVICKQDAEKPVSARNTQQSAKSTINQSAYNNSTTPTEKNNNTHNHNTHNTNNGSSKLKQSQSKPTQLTRVPQKRKSIFLASDDSRTFGQDDQNVLSNDTGVRNQML